MGFTMLTSVKMNISPWTFDRPPTARRGGRPERPPVRSLAQQKCNLSQGWPPLGSTTTFQPQRAHMRHELHFPEYRVSVPTWSTQLGPRRYLREMQGGSYASRVQVGKCKAGHAQKIK